MKPKNVYYDPNTVFEVNNPDAIFQAIVTRYGETKNPKKIMKYIHEYLTERGAKVYRGIKGALYYKENSEMYDGYIDWCKSEQQNDPMSKTEFFRIYAQSRYNEIFNK
jgi:uncharacterized short protein YbdD (DUF466 family)